ncbi:MAG: hypothetical protein IT195_01290 [Microthrixaceae bacterium]|nr:hypothetical protein [Microthrixaceae bacterium]
MTVGRLWVLARLVVVCALVTSAEACSDEGERGTSLGNGTATETTRGVDNRTTTTAGPCRADASLQPGTQRLTVTTGSDDREVERVIPPAFDGTQRLPLIVDLHGFTSTIDQQDLFTGLPAAAAERGYLLLTPQAEDATVPIGDGRLSAPFWNIYPDLDDALVGARNDVGFLAGLIDDAVTELCADASRIYLTGFSNGAGMTAVLACELSGRIAAIAPVSGFNLAADCPDLEPVSVIAFHGDADPLVAYAGGSAARRPIDSPPVEVRTSQFAEVAGCSPEPIVSNPFEDIALREWAGCEPGSDVELYTVLGGGHTWPGMLNYVDPADLGELGDATRLAELAGIELAAIAGHMTTNLEATSVMLDFFDDHPLPA